VLGLIYFPVTQALVVAFVVYQTISEYWSLVDRIVQRPEVDSSRRLLAALCGVCCALGGTGKVSTIPCLTADGLRKVVLANSGALVAACVVLTRSMSVALCGNQEVQTGSMRNSVATVAMDCLGVWYVVWPLSFAPLLSSCYGLGYVVLLLVSSWVGDTGALVVGRAVGQNKLAPRISPKKTWEGCAAQLMTSVATSFALCSLFDLRVGTLHAAALGVITSFGSIAGDLFESFLKRAADVKDSGSFFPGHGGMLDRLDSLLLAFPLVFAYVEVAIGEPA